MKKVISAAIWLFVLLTGTPKVCAATFEGHHLATQIDITAQQQLHRFR